MKDSGKSDGGRCHGMLLPDIPSEITSKVYHCPGAGVPSRNVPELSALFQTCPQSKKIIFPGLFFPLGLSLFND